MTTRIYLVTNGTEQTLVEAANPSQALRAVVMPKYTVEPASALTVAALMKDGAKVTVAGASDE